MQKDLQENLSSLKGRFAALLALALCRRQKANFLLWCSLDETRNALAQSFNKCFDYLSSILQGSGSEKGFESRREELKMVLDGTDDDESFGAEVAADAAATLELGYEAFAGDNDEAAVEAANLCISAVAARVAVENPDMSDDEATSNELLITESIVQTKLVSMVLRLQNVVGPKNFSSAQIQELLKVAVPSGLSNIGLPDDPEDEDQ